MESSNSIRSEIGLSFAPAGASGWEAAREIPSNTEVGGSFAVSAFTISALEGDSDVGTKYCGLVRSLLLSRDSAGSVALGSWVILGELSAISWSF